MTSSGGTTEGVGPGVVERELHIDARPEVVFGFFTDPTQLLRWQGVEADIDARPGGVYRVRMNELGHTTTGRFVEVTPHRRLVYTWGWEVGGFSEVLPGGSTVEVTLEPEAGGTRLRLVHRGLPDVPDLLGQHHGGWGHYLERLAVLASGGDPGPDPHAGGRMDFHERGSG